MMAKQIDDTKTGKLLPVPKKRGRPATGQAMSAAERKRRQRERDTARVWNTPENDQNTVTITGMIEQFAHAVAHGFPGIAEDLSKKLIAIAADKAQQRDRQS